MGREGHCKRILQTCVGSAHSVWITLGLPQLKAVCASRVYTAQAQVSLQWYCPKQALHFMHFPGLRLSVSRVLRKGTYSVVCAFCALPKSEQLRGPGAWWAHCPRWAVNLNHLPSWSSQFPRCAVRAQSQVCHVSALGSWSQAATLLAYASHSGCQKDVVSNWDLLTVWWRMLVSGAEIVAAHCLLALAVALVLLVWGRGLYTAG